MSRNYSTSRRYNANNVSSQRITRSNLITLRSAQMKENTARKMLAAMLSEISSAFAGLFAVRQEKTNSMCKYYGHVIRSTTWKGYLPKCADCGCEINNPNQLRKANAQ